MDKRVIYLDFVKLLLLLGVVAIHTPLIEESTNNPLDMSCSLIIRVIHTSFAIINTSFFFLSGYFFFNNLKSKDNSWQWTIYLNKIKRRINSLVIPYFVWNLIPLIIGLIVYLIENYSQGGLFEITRFYFQGKGPRVFWHFVEWGEGQGYFGNTIAPNSGPINVPLYFIRDLFLLCVLSPLIYVGVRYLKWFFIVLLLFCLITGAWPNITGIRIVGVFYFSLGALFALKKWKLEKLYNLYPKFQYCGLFLVLSSLLFFDFGIINSVLSVLFVLLGLSMLIKISSHACSYLIRIPNILSFAQLAFFIFAAHEGLFILEICRDYINAHITVNDNITSLIAFILIFTSTVLLCTLSYLFLKKIFGAKMWVLTGGR